VLAQTFLALADGEPPPAADVAMIGRLTARGGQRRELRFPEDAEAAVWTVPSPDLVGELARDAARLLTDADAVRRVGACGGCRWVFLDTSRNRSRRWCDPGDCGNRARQRRHYRRQHH
jgi:predicted RNA-binding Zn ribbon-like protein